MMKRRTFLKFTGAAMAGQALGAASLAGVPAASFGAAPSVSAAVLPPMTSTRRINTSESGEYQVSGFVRLQAPNVQIDGITNSQQISWSNIQGPAPVVSFTSLESYARGDAPEIQVLGGQIESVTVTPMMLS